MGNQFLKRTILYPSHRALSARLIDFGGWEMPVQYSSILEEHLAVRTGAGVFDISHMGEIEVCGPRAGEFLGRLLASDVGRLQPGQGQYSFMCLPEGGVVDDLYLYQLENHRFLLVVNASRMERDWAWVLEQLSELGFSNGVQVKNLSESWAAIALQGPRSRAVMESLLNSKDAAGISTMAKNTIRKVELSGHLVWIACTGYTGEDGFELMGPKESFPTIWELLLTGGAGGNVKPCGLGARDTLRLEACYPLFGHELNESTTPIEAGLSYFIGWEKGPFLGREALLKQKQGGVSRKLVAFRMSEPAPPPRSGYGMWTTGVEAQRIGEVTSGSLSPTLGVGIGLAMVGVEAAVVGSRVLVEIRGKRFGAEVVKKPFYRKPI